jgi:hypothetical protein
MREHDSWDMIGLAGTLLGILNYSENLTQSQFNEEISKDTEEIHEHLKIQDKKLDKILEVLLNEENKEDGRLNK